MSSPWLVGLRERAPASGVRILKMKPAGVIVARSHRHLKIAGSYTSSKSARCPANRALFDERAECGGLLRVHGARTQT
jgi:hypothetical protein